MSAHKHIYLYTLLTLLFINLVGCASKPIGTSDQLTLKTARYGHGVVNDGHKIYVIAGANQSGFLSDIEIIDPSTNKINVLANKVIPRRYFSAVWDGKHSIYILGGVSLKNKKFRYEKRVEVFNTQTNTVSFAKPLPAPTRINSAVLLHDRIYVLGGAYPKNAKLSPTALVAVFDIKNDSWVRAANMPTAKTTRAFVKDNFVYVVGGYDRVSSLDVFERFDPIKNQWLSLPSLPAKISAHSISLIENKLFIFGDYNNLTSTYSYDFDATKWEKLAIDYKASRHNATTTLGESTYVIGGNTGTKGPFLDYIQVFKL